MSRNLDSPVQTQMAVAVFKTPLTGGNKMEGNQHKHHQQQQKLQRQSSGRRVFVQTETGCVLGMELDRSDNVHTVKRRLQIALNFPTEESSLVDALKSEFRHGPQKLVVDAFLFLQGRM